MIAKYRKAEYPGEWWLTDFTMGQVEGRLADLARQLAEARTDNSEMINVAGEVIGTDPSLRSSACVTVLSNYAKNLRADLAEAREEIARLRDELERCREMYKRDV